MEAVYSSAHGAESSGYMGRIKYRLDRIQAETCFSRLWDFARKCKFLWRGTLCSCSTATGWPLLLCNVKWEVLWNSCVICYICEGQRIILSGPVQTDIYSHTHSEISQFLTVCMFFSFDNVTRYFTASFHAHTRSLFTFLFIPYYF